MDFELKNFLSGLWGENYNWVKWVHRNLSENHCSECLRLDGCFLKPKNIHRIHITLLVTAF